MGHVSKISRRSLILGGAAWLYTSTANIARAADSVSFEIGSAQLVLHTYASGTPGPTYFAPHEDEVTALTVAKRAVQNYGGRVFWLSHGGGRNITFLLNGVSYTIDPNRMFSNRGAKKSFQVFGNYSDDALRAIRPVAEEIVGAVFGRIGLVIGMHNNTNNNYSSKSYLPGNDLGHEAEDVFVAEGRDPDDFVFTTNLGIFERFKAKGFNVVLQKRRIPDDGSFSVRCQRSGVPYANVEAQHGHKSQQEELLTTLLSL